MASQLTGKSRTGVRTATRASSASTPVSSASKWLDVEFGNLGISATICASLTSVSGTTSAGTAGNTAIGCKHRETSRAPN